MDAHQGSENGLEFPSKKRFKDQVQTEHFFKEVTVKSDIKIREILAWSCVIIIVISIILTYLVIFLVGLKIMTGLPESFLNWLGAATIGTIITNILIVYKGMFPSKGSESDDNS